MSLFIDSDVIQVSDLTGIEPEVTDVADEEGISIDGDNGMILQAWQETADKITANIQTFDGGLVYWPDAILTANMGMNRPRMRLNQIVTSALQARKQSPLECYLTYYALMMFYRAASSRKEIDRYENKFKVYNTEARQSWKELHGIGLPCVLAPLPCPGASHELVAGVFGDANVSPVAGGSGTAPVQIQVAITWVDQSTYRSPTYKGNAESGPSVTSGTTLAAGQECQVSIAGLTPPNPANYQVGTSDGVYTCRTATGWNVYAGLPGALLFLQNPAPIPLASQTFVFDPASLAMNSILMPGQFPDYNITMQRTLRRG